ncbi:hypothetical protein D3C81_843270 [compost metagenome]
MLSMLAAAMPMPLSLRRMRTLSPSRAAAMAMRPPGEVNLAALSSRLATICDRRTASPRTHSSSLGKSMSIAWPRASMLCELVSSALRTTPARLTLSHCSEILPCEIRDTSSRSSTRRTRWSVWRPMVRRALSCMAGTTGSSLHSRASAVRMGPSGLRSSCARVARNSSLRRSTSRSSRSTWPRRSSARTLAINSSASIGSTR